MVVLSIKNLLAHKRRLLSTVTAVVLGVGFLCGVLLLSATINSSFESLFTNANRGTDALVRAREVFASLGMHRTRQRNGVLIYLALADRRLAIVGDDGIHARVGDDYWAALRDHMVTRLQQGQAGQGVLEAIAEAGQTLRRYFPREPGDTDELSDEVQAQGPYAANGERDTRNADDGIAGDPAGEGLMLATSASGSGTQGLIVLGVGS